MAIDANKILISRRSENKGGFLILSPNGDMIQDFVIDSKRGMNNLKSNCLKNGKIYTRVDHSWVRVFTENGLHVQDLTLDPLQSLSQPSNPFFFTFSDNTMYTVDSNSVSPWQPKGESFHNIIDVATNGDEVFVLDTNQNQNI